MFVALDKNNNLIDINNTSKNEEYFCKFCNEKLIIKAKNSIHKAPHFCHKRNSNCVKEWAQHDMSEWHKNWQSYFPLENREVILKNDIVKHIADIFINNTVIEFQHSPISYKNFNNRNQFYTSLGCSVIWVFDATDNIVFSEKDHCDCWKNVQNQFENLNCYNNRVLIFLEVIKNGTPCLFKPKELTPTKIIPDTGFYSYFFLRESFLKTFGILVPENILSIPELMSIYNTPIQRTNCLFPRKSYNTPRIRGARIDYVINNQLNKKGGYRNYNNRKKK